MMYFTYSAVLSGLRSRGIQVLFGLSLLMLGCAWLAAEFSARSPTTLAMDVGFSSLRFILIAMTLLWVQDLLAKDVERKNVLFVLAYPRSRASFVIGQFLGIVVLTGLAALILGSLLWVLLWIGPSEYVQATPVHLGWPYWISLLFVYVAVLVVAAFAVMIATLSTTPMLPLALGLAFAIAATAFGPTLDYLQHSLDADPVQKARLLPALQYARWLLPDLDRLDIRVWPLYGEVPEVRALLGGVAVAAGYIAISLGIGVGRFQRREFS